MLSIVVSWRDRRELGTALPGLLAAARTCGGDLTVVNFGGQGGLLAEQLGPDSGAVGVVETAPQRYFNKACAQNLGAGHTTQPFLFFCDCDIVLGADVVSGLLRRLAGQEGVFGTLAGVRESELNARQAGHITCFGYELRLRTATGRALHIVDNEEDATDGTRQAPGLLMVRRRDFLHVGGYNSRLHGWGWEDQDMIARLTLGAGLIRVQDGVAIHLSHDDHARIAAYPPMKDRWESRDRMFRAALSNYDRADFEGTYAGDLRGVPCELRPGSPTPRRT